MDYMEMISKSYLFFSLGRYQESIDLLNSISKDAPIQDGIYTLLGQNYMKIGKYKDAYESFKIAEQLNPEIPNIHNDYMEATIKMEAEEIVKISNQTNKSKRKSDLFYHADLALGNFQFSQALKIFDEIVLNEPNNPDAWYGRGECLIELSQNDEALKSYNKAVNLHPLHVPFQIGKVNALIKIGKIDEGVNSLDDLVKNFPDSMSAWVFRHYIYNFLHSQAEVDHCFEKIINIAAKYPSVKYPDKIGTYPNFGTIHRPRFFEEILEYRVWVHYKKGGSDSYFGFSSYEDAITHYLKIRNNKEYVTVETPFVMVLKKNVIEAPERKPFKNEIFGIFFEIFPKQLLEKYEIIDKLAESYADKKIKSEEYWLAIARIKIELDQPVEAQKLIEKAIKLDPHHYSYYHCRALSHYLLEDYNETIVDLDLSVKKALIYGDNYGIFNEGEKDKWRADILAEKGHIFFKMNQIDKAIKSYKDSIDFNPNEYKTWASLSVALNKVGDYSKSNNMLNKAKNLYNCPINQKLFTPL